MKALILALTAFCLAPSTYADKHGKTTTPATTTAVTAGMTPTQTCSKLVEAAKTDNYDAATPLIATPAGKGPKMGPKSEARYHKMHKEYLSKIKDITCGTETVAGTRAVVTAESTEEKRLIPFVQQDGAWKFDIKTYRSFYPMGKMNKKTKSM